MMDRVAGVLASMMLRDVVGGTAGHLARDAVWWLVAALFGLVAYVLAMVGGYEWLAMRHETGVALLVLALINLILALCVLFVRRVNQHFQPQTPGDDIADGLGKAISGLLLLILRSPLASALLVAFGIAGVLQLFDTDDGQPGEGGR